MRSSTLARPCKDYACVEHLLTTLYKLDNLPSLPLHRRRRPHPLSAAHAVTDIARARAIPSSPGRASYT